MLALRGERFDIDLSDDTEVHRASRPQTDENMPMLVGDIQERPMTKAGKHEPPVMKSGPGGFPAHRKRIGLSRFKQERQAVPDARSLGPTWNAPGASSSSPPMYPEDGDSAANERSAIDCENRKRLASMSDEAINEQREELLRSLDPYLLRNLLQCSSLIDRTNKGPLPPSFIETNASDGASRQVSFKQDHAGSAEVDSCVRMTRALQEADEGHQLSSLHFPKPSQPTDLDPEDPAFLDNIHAKYFASLPTEPSKLGWMRSSSGSVYQPDQDSVRIAELRFDFQGALLPPRKASSIPVTAGLHHHGDAPDSAGYTIPELAHLSRSSNAMQRCIAYQTLGRLLYRLSQGNFGEKHEPVPKGLWRMIQEGRVLDTLQEAANSESGHMSARSHATEALWLWQRGGGYAMDAT